jgi:hypothetical protein
MTIDTAKQIGGRRALINQVYAIVIWELICLFVVTEGDIANGLIFFIDEQMNPALIAFFVLLLGATYLLGRRAGKEIYNRPDRYVKPGLKYAMLVRIIVFAYLVIVISIWGRAPEGLAAFGAILGAIWMTGTIVGVWLVAAKEVMRKLQGAN